MSDVASLGTRVTAFFGSGIFAAEIFTPVFSQLREWFFPVAVQIARLRFWTIIFKTLLEQQVARRQIRWHARCKYGRQLFNPITTMKNQIKLLALVLAAGLPGVAFAQVAGAHLPTALNTESVFGAFAIVGIVLGAVSDYSRKFQPLPLNSSTRPVSAAPTLVVHEPAYGIRRGSEVARLAA
jgi:hypothetical protein